MAGMGGGIWAYQLPYLLENLKVERDFVASHDKREVRMIKSEFLLIETKLLGFICRQAVRIDKDTGMKIIFLASKDYCVFALFKNLGVLSNDFQTFRSHLTLKKLMDEFRPEPRIYLLEIIQATPSAILVEFVDLRITTVIYFSINCLNFSFSFRISTIGSGTCYIGRPQVAFAFLHAPNSHGDMKSDVALPIHTQNIRPDNFMETRNRLSNGVL